MAEADSKKRATLSYGMVLTRVFRSQGVSILENEPLKRLRHTDYYNSATLHRMGFKKVNGIWLRKGQDELRATGADSVDHGPSEVGPSARHHSPPPSCSEPPEAPPATPAPAPTVIPDSAPPSYSSSGFSDIQLEQLKNLLANHEDRIKAELEVKFLNIKEILYSIEDKVTRFGSSFETSSEALKSDIKLIFEKIKDIGGDSDIYSKCNAELQDKIVTASAFIDDKLNGFMNVQKEGMGKILEELQRLLRF